MSDTHNEIMNIRCEPAEEMGLDEKFAYRLGHRDARHAAAEIAAAKDAEIERLTRERDEASQILQVVKDELNDMQRQRDKAADDRDRFQMVGKHYEQVIYNAAALLTRHKEEDGSPAFAGRSATLWVIHDLPKLVARAESAESTVASLRRELEDKDAVIEKLPHTADSVPVVPGMRLFWLSADEKSSTDGYVVSELSMWSRTPDDDFNGSVIVCLVGSTDEGGVIAAPCDFGLYSTREAALASTKGVK